jgi:hypothetical protein
VDGPFSILFPGPVPALLDRAPTYFADLNLDQVLKTVLAGRDDYELAPYFYTRLTDPASVGYRHEVFADLDRDPGLRSMIGDFAQSMTRTRQAARYAETVHNDHERQAWHLHAAQEYVTATGELYRHLVRASTTSAALRGFAERLSALIASAPFTELAEHVGSVAQQLYDITYCLDIHGDRIRVTRYENEVNYEAEVRAIFAKFEQTDTERPTHDFHSHVDLNWVEAKILDLVAALHPDQFTALAQFRDHHPAYLAELVTTFDREIQFYCAVLQFRDRLNAAGLRFCLPRILADSKALTARGLFDIALADKLLSGKLPATAKVNDVELSGAERAIVVTGPNQGGKTTFARSIGQLYHWAALGAPVPGVLVRIRLCDKLFSHFEREENLDTLSGKLEDDLRRVHDIVTHATADSVVVMNESFSSTSLEDARRLGTAVLSSLLALDIRCVYVTFVDELSRLNEATVSMVATVDPHDPAVRTFHVVRRRADGLAYAAALAEQHGLTYERITERMTP